MTPITTATNTAGTPITTGSDPIAIAITPLAAPSGLVATVAGPVSGPPSGVALTWTDNVTAPVTALLRVERASDPGFSTGVTDVTVGAAATSYTDTAVVEGAAYYYRVRAENEASKSAWSNTVSVVYTTVPAAPGGLTATVTGPVSGPPAGVSLHWTNTTGGALVTHMVVRRATDPGLTTGLADFLLGAAATSYTDTAVTEGTTYYYRVRAENEVSTSAWSNTVSVFVPDVISVTSPGSQSTYIGFLASQQIHASSGAGLPLSYSATGLPPGLSISNSGLITGTAAGPARSYTPTVTVTDGTASHSVTFTWKVKSAAAVYSGTIRLTKMGYCLDDRNNSSSNGAVVQVWRCTGGPNQVWQVMSDGTIRHNGLCLDAPGTGNGTKVVLAACTPGGPAGPDQQWNTRNWR